MCSGSQKRLYFADWIMEGLARNSILLELAAADDLEGFRDVLEKEGIKMDESGIWYGRKIGSNQMGFEERTPLMVASIFGSKQVVKYILDQVGIDVNRACGSDGATPLHCAIAGGSAEAPEIVKLLLDASADVHSVDASGKRPADLLARVQNSCFSPRKKMLQLMLNGGHDVEKKSLNDLNDQHMGQGNGQISASGVCKDGTERKEYPIDPSLPDINTGLYGTDEFRMYTFKIKPCSRAYSHDWTECPFAHPGENARRRDPRKYHYSCVPCPEFRKGSCHRGDLCEYAHGIFECWLHPAQYRTRLCKDETNCARRVCFFAHKLEELRPLYASTGSAVPSPRSFSPGGSPSSMMPPTSALPLTPSGGSSMWANSALAPLTLQFPGSRLKSAMNARGIHLDAELLGLNGHHHSQQQYMDDFTCLSSPTRWSPRLNPANTFSASLFDQEGDVMMHNGLKPANFDDMLGSLDSTIVSPLQGLSVNEDLTQLLSPRGFQLRQNMNLQPRPSYTPDLSSSPARRSSFGLDLSSNPRSAAFAQRSQSFIERSPVKYSGNSSPISGPTLPSALSDWSSPDGKLDWGIHKEDSNKLRKSASFGLRNSGNNFVTMARGIDEADASWNQALVKDFGASKPGAVDLHQYQLNGAESEVQTSWLDQLYMEEQIRA